MEQLSTLRMWAYPVFLLLAVIAGAITAVLAARRARVPVRQFLPSLAASATGALVGAKLYAILEAGRMGSASVYELAGGYRYPGGVIGCFVALALVAPRGTGLPGLGALADLLAPSFGFGIAVSRVGCLLRGCCWGMPTDLPWGIRFPHGSAAWHAQAWNHLISSSAESTLPVHPLQVYFLLLAAGSGVMAWRLQSRKRFDGQVMLAFLAVQATGKGILETLRGTYELHIQLLSLAMGLSACAWLWVWRRRGMHGRAA